MQKSKFLLILLIPLGIIGCATEPSTEPAVEVRTIRVEVPIPVVCKAEIPPPPEICFTTLNQSDDIYIKSRCMLSDRIKSIAYELQLLTALNSCK